MNSRERLLATLEHQPTDRIPTDFNGTCWTGITASALYHLRQCLGMETPVRTYDVYESLGIVDEAAANELKSDVWQIPTPVPLLNMACLMEQTKKSWKSYALEDGIPVWIPKDFYPERELNGDLCLRDQEDRRFALLKRGTHMFLPLTQGPGAMRMSPQELAEARENRHPLLGCPKDETYLNLLKVGVKMLSQTSDKALVMNVSPSLPFFAGLGRGNVGGWLEWLAGKDGGAERLLQCWLETWLAELEQILEVTENALDVLVLQDDFSEVVQPEEETLIREKILPCYAAGIQKIREKNRRGKILWQSRGNVTPYIPALLEAGVEALGLVDLSPLRMNPLWIKKEYGRQITLWGGCCSAEELQSISEENLLKKLRETVEILQDGGGYIHALSGNILPQTPPENIVTFFSPRGGIN